MWSFADGIRGSAIQIPPSPLRGDLAFAGGTAQTFSFSTSDPHQACIKLETRVSLRPSRTPSILLNSLLYFGLIGVLRKPTRDRKSTRLNSSHLGISYAVF